MISLYDIPSTKGAWAPNTWKTRYALNIRGLSFETVWVEFPDIEPVCKQIGAALTSKEADETDFYTLPVIRDHSTNAVVSDSFRIAQYLEAAYPSTPQMLPAGTAALQAAFQAAVWSTVVMTNPSFMILVPAVYGILHPRSHSCFRERREKLLGKKLEEFSPDGPVRDTYWKEIETSFKTVAGWRNKNNGEQPYVMGEVPTHADVVIAGILQRIKLSAGEGSKEWNAVQTWDDGRWKRLLDNLKQYE